MNDSDEFSTHVNTRRELISLRILDVVSSIIGIILSAPAWLVIAVAIKLEDGGPVLFSHQRLGKGGEPFVAWKFRSMIPDHDLPPIQGHPERSLVTNVGQFIRPTALDELPQLWNILKGDMSLVGPRADVPEEVGANVDGKLVQLQELPGYSERLAVKPGLTGLAQIKLPRDAPYSEKIKYDIKYIRNRSLWLYLRLVLQSVWISLRGGWAENSRVG